MSQVFFLPIKETKKLAELALTAGLAKILRPDDFVAVKLHFGEAGNIGFIKPPLVKPVVESHCHCLYLKLSVSAAVSFATSCASP